jgi:release factor glutamine methyltransferase
MNTRARLLPLDERMAPLEARYIVMHAAGKTHEELVRDYHIYASDKISAEVDDMVNRRLNGEPPAYIVGSWEFYGLPMCITRDVLIPRVDTEVLAEAAIERLDKSGSPRVLDLCTGSGCVGLAIARNVPNAKITLLDISENALRVAKLNARALGLTVNCVAADVLKPPSLQLGCFDMIVCNPPYIPSAEIERLDASVKNFEPLCALDGGEDGLDFYRAVVKSWSRLLKDGGYLLFELGAGQLEAVRQICLEEDFAAFEVLRDTGGIDRVLAVERVEM